MATVRDRAILEVDGDFKGLQKEVKETQGAFARMRENSELFATEWNSALEMIKKGWEGMKIAFESAQFAGKEFGGEFNKEMVALTKSVQDLGKELKLFLGTIAKEVLDIFGNQNIQDLVMFFRETRTSLFGQQQALGRRSEQRVQAAGLFVGREATRETADLDLRQEAAQVVAIWMVENEGQRGAERLSNEEILWRALNIGMGSERLRNAYKKALQDIQKGKKGTAATQVDITAGQEFVKSLKGGPTKKGFGSIEDAFAGVGEGAAFSPFGGGATEVSEATQRRLAELGRIGAGPGGVGADPFAEIGDFDEAMAQAKELTIEFQAQQVLISESMALIESATFAALNAAITGEQSITAAIKNALRAELKAVSLRATVKAAEHTAMGFAALALGGPFGGSSASQHFKAAGMYAAVAGLAGGASGAVGAIGGGGSGGGGAGAVAPPPAAGGFAPPATSAAAGGGTTIIVNVGEGFVGKPKELGAAIQEQINISKRAGFNAESGIVEHQ